MLPHESEVQAEIAARFSKQLSAMTSLHDAVVKMLTARQWTVGNEGYNQFIVNAMMGAVLKGLTRGPQSTFGELLAAARRPCFGNGG